MRKVLICSIAALVILLAGGTGTAKERTNNKEANTKIKNVGEKKNLSEQDKQWKEKFKAMTPEQKRLALAQRAFDEEMAPWQQVRKIAVEENATKTLAAIDKIIAGKKEQFNKKAQAIKEGKPAQANKPKAEGTRGQRTGRKKQTQTQE
jgi:predicted Rossmann-fold nucleotide-binding protein